MLLGTANLEWDSGKRKTPRKGYVTYARRSGLWEEGETAFSPNQLLKLAPDTSVTSEPCQAFFERTVSRPEIS